MSEMPKIVQDRLRAAAPRESHPDADVLSAFAEHCLSGSERENVVRHLARCGDCREVMALSIPPMETVAHREMGPQEVSTNRSAATSRPWLAWPSLRWAAVAACVVVVGSVLFLRNLIHDEALTAVIARQTGSAAPHSDASAQPPNSPASGDKIAQLSEPGPAKPDRSVLPEKRAVASDEPRFRAQPSPSGTSGARLADNKRLELPVSKGNFFYNENKVQARGTTFPSAPASVSANGSTAASELDSTSQQVEVLGGSAGAAQSLPVQGGLLARNDAPLPIEKAKPAAKEESRMKAAAAESATQQKSALGYSDSSLTGNLQKLRSKQSTDSRDTDTDTKNKNKDSAAQWSLVQGRLQRSLDSGASWQITLQPQHPLLSFGARGNDVWAGGQGGTLFHSVNSGATWTNLQPSSKAAALTADIVAIDVRGPAEIVLTTANNESWITRDAGQSWEKK